MITLLNTSILTNFGKYEYDSRSLNEIKEMFGEQKCNCYQMHPCLYCGGSGVIRPSFQSAIGHQSTAEILTELLGVDVKVNRIQARDW